MLQNQSHKQILHAIDNWTGRAWTISVGQQERLDHLRKTLAANVATADDAARDAGVDAAPLWELCCHLNCFPDDWITGTPLSADEHFGAPVYAAATKARTLLRQLIERTTAKNEAPALAPPSAPKGEPEMLSQSAIAAEWKPPPNHVRAVEISGTGQTLADPKWSKLGKNPPRTTLEKWAKTDKVKPVKDPKGESWYCCNWLTERIQRWRPQERKRVA